jgi:hypothetical protein
LFTKHGVARFSQKVIADVRRRPGAQGFEAFLKEDDPRLAQEPHPGDRFVDPRFSIGLSEAADLVSCVADKSLNPP